MKMRPKLQFLSILVLSVTASLSVAIHTTSVGALSPADWNAGRIVDDMVFQDNASMTVDEIQRFLNAKTPSCDTGGAKRSEYGGGTRAQYGASRGNPTPFTCLKDYREVPKTTPGNYIPANNYGWTIGTWPAGAKSAAEIIWQAAQDYNISPKTLLVTLQKESGLVTDDWTFRSQLVYAMGAHCPDSGPNGSANCDVNYSGFSLQIRESAELMRSYLNNMQKSWWSLKKPYQNNYIQWTVASACGGTNVYISNKATAALYTYTPYQPNQASLNAGWATGDSCSSYGNRNFWLYFNEWFGSAYMDGYVGQFHAQSPSFTEPFYPGEARQVFLQYKNVGNARWYDDSSVPAGLNPVHLAASVPTNRQSVFSYGWPSSGRPNFTFSRVYEADGTTLASNQHVVEPGQIARFEFNVTPPWNVNLGTHREYFQPVLENASNWNMGGVAWLDIEIGSRYKAGFVSQLSTAQTLQQNSTVSENRIRIRNTGSAAWYDTASVPSGYYPTQFVTTAPGGRSSLFAVGWPSKEVASVQFSNIYESGGTTLTNNQHIVMPGQIGEFTFKTAASANINSGNYREYFQPILSGSPHPGMGLLAWFDTNVTSSSHKAQFYSQSLYPTISKGQPNPSFLQYKNVGNARWYDDSSVPAGLNPVHLAASVPTNRQSVFSYGWPSSGRPNFTFSRVYEADGTTLASNQHVVEPGQIARFEFNVTPPWNVNLGTHREYFQPVLENASNWNMGGVAWLDIYVTP